MILGSCSHVRNNGQRGADSWIFEGWLCQPDKGKGLRGLNPVEYCSEDDKNEFLYIKYSATANTGAIIGPANRPSCRRHALDQISSDEGFAKILGDFLERTNGLQKGTETARLIIAQGRTLLGDRSIYACCSMNPYETGQCVPAGEPDLWNECLCVGAFKYPGGQRSFAITVGKANFALRQ